MALAYSREFLTNRLKLCTDQPTTGQIPSDLSNLMNYAGSFQSTDEANSIATSLSDSSLSPTSTATTPKNKIHFELGESDDGGSLTDGAASLRRTSESMPGELDLTDSDATPQGMRYLADDDSDLEERLLMVAAGQSPASSALGHAVPRKLSFHEPGSLEFTRRRVSSVPQASMHKSLLSSAISSIGDGDPLNRFLSAAATAESSLPLGVYFAFSDNPDMPMQLKVRGDATVNDIIGYSLRSYRKSATLEQQNPNWYNLRLHDEDGEPDDDFPALERKRPISSYSLDEIVLVRASQHEFDANSRETPFESSTSRNESVTEPENQQITVKVFMFPFDYAVSNIYWNETVPSTSSASSILETVCKQKHLSNDDYALREVNTRPTLDPDVSIGTLKPQLMARFEPAPSSSNSDDGELVVLLELVPKRAITEDDSVRSPSKRKNTSDSIPSSFAPAPIPNVVGLNFQRFGYYKYRVWRRQHVSFLGRQERELAIDGEYVYIIPPSDRSLIEQPKTTTFHIRQVIRCKQSSKIAVYLKIFVMKQTGPKRYDIDCQTAEDCVEIVQRINRLMKSS